MRVLVDTGVFVSALIKPVSAPGQVVRAIAEGEIEIVVSAKLLEELRAVLARPKFASDFTVEQAQALLRGLTDCAELVADPEHAPYATRDPKDDYLVAVARAAKVDALITGDRDLLDAQLSDVNVVTPRALLTLLG